MTFSTLSPSPQRHPLRVWLLGVLAAVAVLGLAATLLVAMVFPSNHALAGRAAQALENAQGVPVSIGALNWQLWPQPRVKLLDVSINPPAAPGTTDAADGAPSNIGGAATAATAAFRHCRQTHRRGPDAATRHVAARGVADQFVAPQGALSAR